MEISSIRHIEPASLIDFQANLFITTLSHESRCTTISRRVENLVCKKIALCKCDDEVLKEFAYEENLNYFDQSGFDLVKLGKGLPDVGQILGDLEGEEVKILFDCTSMSQLWYHEFFRWIGESQDRFSKLTIRFTYTLTAYVDEGPPKKVKKISEFVQGESRNNKQKKALILGLGHESRVSEAIYKKVKPDLLFLYYTDPPVDKRFVDKVFVNNHALINVTPIRNLIAYPVFNGQEIYQSLIDTILPLRNEYSILMIPHGPKIFSVATMLVQLGYPDTMIAYPLFRRGQILDRIPWGEPVIMDVLFEEDE